MTVCSICSRSDVLSINRDLVSGQPRESVALRYGCAAHSLKNHYKHHISRQLAKSVEMRQMSESNNLASEMSQLVLRTKAILTDAESKGLHTISLKAISELRSSYGFMVAVQFQLREDERQERSGNQRLEVDDLKEHLSRIEMETLLQLSQKAKDGSGPSLISVKWSSEPSYYPSVICTQGQGSVIQDDLDEIDPDQELDDPSMDDPSPTKRRPLS